MTSAVTFRGREFASHEGFMAFMAKRIAAHDADKGTAPAIRPDAIELWSPVTGKVATSKSRYYREVRQAGCEINPQAGIRETNRPEFRSAGLALDIKRAIETCASRHGRT
jgi:hypothetical protein